MAVRELRFFASSTSRAWLLALVFANVGAARVRRAETDALKLRRAALWQTAAALAIVVSIPWWRPLLRS